ncbi:MAG TPA: hypothetical protein VMV77_18375 [Bacteroidales bacterium]|nr:hypothetical protein [Bacteroidales bacterium]
MNRTGKITVAFFLNKNVKPDLSHPMFSGSGRYPLYIQVTYNRRNTQFRSFHRQSYTNLEEAFFSKEDNEHRKYEESLIKKVVEYEVKHLGKDFQLKGLNDRYRNYSEYIFNPIDKYFRDIIYNAIVKTNSEFFEILDPWKLQQVSFHIYYKAASNLINDLEKILPYGFSEDMKMGLEFLKWAEAQDELIKLIDWLDHSAINAYESYLVKKKHNEIQIKTMIEFINRVLKISVGLVVY